MAMLARALFDYEGVEAAELSMVCGDILEIEEENESGWFVLNTMFVHRVSCIVFMFVFLHCNSQLPYIFSLRCNAFSFDT